MALMEQNHMMGPGWPVLGSWLESVPPGVRIWILVSTTCLLISGCSSSNTTGGTAVGTPERVVKPAATSDGDRGNPAIGPAQLTALASAPTGNTVTNLINDALNTTSKLERFHYVMTQTGMLGNPSSMEGYVIEPSNAYLKATLQNGSTVEELVLRGSIYKRMNGGGKWETYVPPGSTPTPDPVGTQSILPIKQLIGPWSDNLGVLHLEYEGLQSVNGMNLLYFAGKEVDISAHPQVAEPYTISLWIDPNTRYLRRVYTFSRFPPRSQSNQSDKETRTPQQSAEVVVEQSVTLDRFNDPTITLPTP